MKAFWFLLLLVSSATQAQELFVFTEPASNMPSKSLGVRVSNTIMKVKNTGGYNYHLLPEIMWGANKRLMIHFDGFISNRNKNLVTEGTGLYAKYRFLSIDNIHSHFRLAALGRLSYNNSDIHQEEIETAGHNSGFEAGVIATQLLNKVAVSSTISYEKALDNNRYKFPLQQSDKATNYTLSVGKLMLPKEYINYKQTNLNLMVEFLGQTLNGNRRSYLDVAPALQLILNSQARIDVGYRRQLYSSMLRTAPNGFMIRVEYLFFNAFK